MPSRSPLRPLALLALPVVLATAGCSGWFFSGPDYPDRSRPLARIETQGGIEYGATTEFGVLFLGRTATEGPCRVRMFLGEQLIVDDGKIEPFGAGIWRASIDLVGQGAPLWTTPVTADLDLVALCLDGPLAVDVPVRLALLDGVSGDVVESPGRDLPAGTPIFVRDEDERLWFAGLVSARATLTAPGGAEEELFVFAGPRALAEALEQPENNLAPVRIKYRPDGIWLETQERRTAAPPAGDGN
ncbi:MAG: hypothetical protein O2865_09885 [Planctomycetota bacterium]|nr:hypothetical protein [Planctomycetota bacterium]MDA0934184.1 hypothetical protein [Planctomycetota bacterium]